MDKTEVGRAGELAMALYAMVSSDGELQLFTPVADDDHVDATAGRRGGVPAIAIQVKAAPKVDRSGSVEARASYPVGRVREHPAFLYAVLLLSSVTIKSAWIIPSPDFNRIAYRHTASRREILEFRGNPVRDDRYSTFRVPPLEIGPRLLAVIDSLEERIPLHVIRATAGLMVAARRTP
ncbi:MAG TPA: hypothetical protein VGU71_02465 [Candidatus Dormibacteraeota bacterium]|nr:hypothetical protein [Candidatus Dormibacteraeota bacterium]